MRRERLPVIVLAGGLGSGKTTLLNHLLLHGGGHLGVIVNDFGQINVDAFLVGGATDARAAITGGCLCCIADSSELDDALTGLSRPAAGLDAVVIEASGLAEPRALARMVMSSPVPTVRFGGVVLLADAAAWAAAADDDEARAHLPAPDALAVASLVVVTKGDLVDDAQLERLEHTLREHAPVAPLVRAIDGAVDPALLLDTVTQEAVDGEQLSLADLLAEQLRRDGGDGACACGDDDREDRHHRDDDGANDHHDHARGYLSVSVESDLPVQPSRLVEVLSTRPRGLYRVKGAAWVDAPGAGRSRRWVVQAVGGWVSFEQGPWPEGDPRTTRLVAIGHDLDEAAVRASLASVLSDAGRLPAEALVPLQRFARR